MANVRGSRTLRCNLCGATFTRQDHLNRHRQTHTGVKDHICGICGRKFTRQDMLRRHERTHSRPFESIERIGEDSQERSLDRVDRACARCAAKKLKCSNEKPCWTCQKSGITCGLPPRSLIDPADARSTVQAEQYGRSTFVPEREADDYGLHANLSDLFEASQYNLDPSSSLSNEISPGLLGAWPDVNVFSDIGALDATLDMDMLTDVNVHNIGALPLGLRASAPSHRICTVFDAYQASVFREWRPGSEEGGEASSDNLTVLPPQSMMPPQFLGHKGMPMSTASRDRLLHMALESSSSAAKLQILNSFPTIEILSAILQGLFVGAAYTCVNQFVHLPSLDLDKIPIELLGALIALAAVNCPSASVRAFGYGLQESVRLALQRHFNADNAIVRQLSMLQAFYVQHRIAFFSAMRKKIEVAESLAMMGVTHLRRSGRLKATDLTYSFPEPGSSFAQKQSAWQEWIEQESWQRLIYTAFILDAQFSLSRHIGISLSAAEVHTPLPQCKDLWNATGPDQWYQLSTSSEYYQSSRNVSISRVAADPSILFNHPRSLDLELAIQVMVWTYWSLIHELHKLSTLGDERNVWDSFVLKSRYAELRSALQEFRSGCDGASVTTPEIRILLSIVSMHLCVDLEDLHEFAGRHSESGSFTVQSKVERWFNSDESFIAVCHAGQVFAGAKALQKSMLHDMNVIALFQAIIVIWVYGTMMRLQDVETSTSLQDQSTIRHIYIDDLKADPGLLCVFRKSSRLGIARLTGQFISLSNAAAVAEQVQITIRSNFGQHPPSLCAGAVLRFVEHLGLAVV